MTKQKLILLVVLCVLLTVAGCTKAKPMPIALPGVVSTNAPTNPPASATPVPPPPTEAPASTQAQPTAQPAVVQSTVAPTVEPEPAGPILQAPPDGLAAKLFDLVWEWDKGLGTDEWYEVQVWPDGDGAQPKAFAWTNEPSLRVTSAKLAPGRYNWRVVVVAGKEAKRGAEKSPVSETQLFTIMRPLVTAPRAAAAGAAEPADFGDAPSGAFGQNRAMSAYPAGQANGAPAGFQTVFSALDQQFGPMHLQPQAGAWLGAAVTVEESATSANDPDGKPNIDLAGNKPDGDAGDDGLVLETAPRDCGRTTFQFSVTYSPKGERREYYLNAWFDWNRDGKWGDVMTCTNSLRVDEWAVKNQPVPYRQSGTYRFTSRRFAAWNPNPDQPMWLRLTLSEKPLEEDQRDGRGPADGYQFGETEDYYLTGLKQATSTPIVFVVTATPRPTSTATGVPTIGPSPTSTITPLPTVPTIVVPTVVTPTVTAPTPTNTPGGYPLPTSVQPTNTPGGYPYPVATNTTAPVQPTNTPGGYPAQPTNTIAPVQPTNTTAPVQPTNTPGGYPSAPTNTPGPVLPTNTPGGYVYP